MQEMSLGYHFTVEQEVGSSTYAFFGFNGNPNFQKEPTVYARRFSAISLFELLANQTVNMRDFFKTYLFKSVSDSQSRYMFGQMDPIDTPSHLPSELILSNKLLEIPIQNL
jgi:hypothetical protein